MYGNGQEMNRIRVLRVLAANVFLGGVVASSSSLAHHALIAYDNSRVIEMRGVIEEVFWANPHVRLVVRAADDTVWDLEGPPVNRMERDSGIRREFFPVGEEAVFTGFPSRRGEPSMRPILARLSSGQTIVFAGSHVDAVSDGNHRQRRHDHGLA